MQHLQANIIFLGQVFRNSLLLCASPVAALEELPMCFLVHSHLDTRKQTIICFLHETTMPEGRHKP